MLAGPTMPPARGPASHLVVMVHGYGADGQDLIGLADHWRQMLPTVAFSAPNAPARVPGAPGYQWFAISRIDPHEMQMGVEQAGPVLDAFVDAELARLGLPPERLALVGFSQGTMLSLHVGLRRKVRPAAIVGFSGLLAGSVPPSANDGADIPPILLTHGDSDSVIPPQAMFLAASQLGLAGAAVQWHLAPGMGHGIDPEGLTMAGIFLGQAFAGRLRRLGQTRCVYKVS
ncbi:MAG: phospholipase [Alphaproteobacteria bacterium 64-11]|nr:MAG: phospholipase [Alphaproteobacteria bacterium 64-11]